MADSIVVIDTSAIHEGKLGDVQQAIRAMVDFVAVNEPRVLAYTVYLNADGTRMTVVQMHPDSASMEFHMTAAAPVFQPFRGLIELLTMDVYGEPSESLMDQLRRKAHLLGTAVVRVHEPIAGFVRQGFISAPA